jgi:hypothetical protein
MSAVSVDRTYLAWASTAAFDPFPTSPPPAPGPSPSLWREAPTSSAKRPLVAYCNDARLPSGGASDGTVDQMLRLRRARPITRSD